MRANHVGNTAMGVDVIGTILRVVFHHKNQRVIAVGAVRYLIHQQAKRIIVVRHLLGKSIDPVNSGTKTSKVVVWDAEKLQAGEVAVSHKLVKLTLPFLEAPEIRKLLVITAEERICDAL